MDLVQLSPVTVNWDARVNALVAEIKAASNMKIKDAVTITRVELTQASKMPCKTYNLPTRACKTGSKLRAIPGTICSDCYACKGLAVTYADTVLPSQEKHLLAIKHELWPHAMARLIGRAGKWFRWHSSGDVQSVDHFAAIVAIARALPKVTFWLPTREIGYVTEFLKTGTIPSNLIVRLSAARFDAPAPSHLTGFGSTSHYLQPVRPEAFECRAPKQGNECRNCRACWSRNVPVVSYHRH